MNTFTPYQTIWGVWYVVEKDVDGNFIEEHGPFMSENAKQIFLDENEG